MVLKVKMVKRNNSNDENGADKVGRSNDYNHNDHN